MWHGKTDLGDFGYSRVSFELRDEDLETARANKHVSVSGFNRSAFPGGISARRNLPVLPAGDAETAQWQEQHPCILHHFPEFLKSLDGKRVAVFLDYDGTLAPIVSNPDDAFMSEQMRDVVRSVAQLFPTAIISGRGREKVEAFVQLKELYYAGSHGMDIASPKVVPNGQVADSTFQPAAQFRPLIDQVYSELLERLKEIPGSSVEHNVFCVSAHFRNCAGEAWQEVVTIAESIVAKNPQLRMTRGRKVCEIRPQVEWHKGTALRHLLEVLHLRNQPDVVALYIGDDHTDEDAFRELKESKMGYGILVSTKIKTTAARYTVRDPCQVQDLLSRLVAWGHTPSNGWHACGMCTHSGKTANGACGGEGVAENMWAADALQRAQG